MTETSIKAENPPASGVRDLASASNPAVLLSLLIAALFGVYLLLTSTTNLIPGIWLYDAKRILQFALLFVLFLVPAFNGRIREEFGNTLVAIPRGIKITLLAVFAWGVVSVLINAQSLMQGLNSFSEVALLSALVLGVFVVAACRRIAGRSFDRVAIGLIAMTGLVVGAQELIGVVAAHNAGVDFNFRISLLHFSWPRFYNQVQSWTIPVLVALPVLFARYRLAYIVCVLVLGLQWYIILATGARGSFVSLGAAMIFALVLLPPLRSRLLIWQGTGFVLGAMIFALVLLSFEADGKTEKSVARSEFSQSQVIREAEKNAAGDRLSGGESSFFKQSVGRPMIDTSGRIWMWRTTLEDVKQNPLMGIGPMNYVCTSPKYIGHPHNFPLQLAAEWGIPVAITVCALFGLLIWRTSNGIRQNDFGDREDSTLAGLLLIGVLAAGLHACLSGVMVMPASQVTGLLVSGMLLGLYPDSQQRRITRAPRLGFSVGILFAVFLLGIGSYELNTMQDRAVLLKPGEDMRPRIWQDAKVCRLYSAQIEVKN